MSEQRAHFWAPADCPIVCEMNEKIPILSIRRFKSHFFYKISNRDIPRVPLITRGGGHSLEATEAPREGAHEAAATRPSTQQATTPRGLALRAAGSLSLSLPLAAATATATAATADRRHGDEALLARAAPYELLGLGLGLGLA